MIRELFHVLLVEVGTHVAAVDGQASLLVSLEVPQTGLWGTLRQLEHDPYHDSHS